MVYFPLRLRRAVLRRERYRCAFCGQTNAAHKRETKHNARLHFHHIWPRRVGGGESKHNLIALCDNCHANMEARTRFILRNLWSEKRLRAKVCFETWKRTRTDHPTGRRRQMAWAKRLQRYRLERKGVL